MRRMTILLAGMGALLLAPVAAQAATGVEHVKINVEGNGSGKVWHNPEASYGGTPEPDCYWNGKAQEYKEYESGKGLICETLMSDEGEGYEQVFLFKQADPGSVFVKWTVKNVEFEGCSPSVGCLPYVEPSGSGEDNGEVTALFCLEGESEEECLKPPVKGPELTVTKEGTGSGTVVSNPAGIECGGTCKASFETNTKVTLTASPAAGSLFVSWKGCEKGGVNGRQCTVTMDKAKTVYAKFVTAYDVTVNRVGSGLGKVGSSPGGVLCLSNCSSTTAAFKEGTSVTLTATPSKNYVFTEWTGDCSGSGTCSLGALGADKTVGAKFTAVPQHLLTVTKSGGGQGTAKSNVAGINCGVTCPSMASAYYQGAVVELTATPGKGSTFGGWSGSGCSGTGTCTVTMSAAKAVTAEFK